MFEIINDDPPPDSYRKGYKWPFSKMVVNQSIVISRPEIWPYAIHAAQSVGRYKYWKFTTRWNKEKNEGKIWRVS